MVEIPEDYTESVATIGKMETSVDSDPTGRMDFIRKLAGGVGTLLLANAGVNCAGNRHLCECVTPEHLTFPGYSGISNVFDIYCMYKPKMEKFVGEFERFQSLSFEEKMGGILADNMKRNYEHFRLSASGFYDDLKRKLAVHSAEEWFKHP